MSRNQVSGIKCPGVKGLGIKLTFGIRHQGVIIYSSLPEYIMRHEGSPESFKSVLDEYLMTIPDQPEVGGLIPGARTLTGKSSNSILDWPRSMGRMIY